LIRAMKPFLEKIRPEPGASWAMLNRRLDDEIPFQWHHHPEYELTLTLNSRGQRFIGDHIGAYDDGDLVLVGPNLPHTWTSREKIVAGEPHVALVMWFLPAWAAPLGSVFAEMRPVSDMLARAGAGLAFSGEAAAAARPTIETLFARPAVERLLLLLDVLARLAEDRRARPLASPGFAAPQVSDNRERIDRVLDYLHQNYTGEISTGALADIAALSASGLHRLFRRHTRQTVSAYVMRLRIGEACALLSGSQRPIAHIANDVGYDSLANFNRQFKALKGLTPREYRQNFA
jgi:AraC-like DNA-binding protein